MGREGDSFQLFHTYKFYRNAHYRNGGYDDTYTIRRHPSDGKCLRIDVCSLRFAQEVLYHLHLSWCEDAFIASVAEVGEGLEQASGFFQFLAEEVYGTLVAMVGVV